MSPAEFRARARRLWRRIPARYREGVDALVVSTETQEHPTLPGVYTLGECRTEAYPSEYEGPETTRSVLALYYGSFRALAAREPDFDWDAELWDTLTHELKHHLESLAREDELGDYDYAADQHFRRLQGEPFDPYFFELGEPVAPGGFRIEGDVYVTSTLEVGGDVAGAGRLAFDWHGARFTVPAPAHTGDVCFVRVTAGLGDVDGQVYAVLVRRRGALASLRALFDRAQPDVVEAEGVARPASARL